MKLSLDTSRTYLIGKNYLLQKSRPLGAAGVAQVVESLGSLQMDPLTIVTRSHDLVLRHRVGDYQSSDLSEALYSHRKLFDYGGFLAVHPASEYAAWRFHMQRRQVDPAYQDALNAVGGPDRMLDALRERGPMSAREIGKLVRTSTVDGTKPASGSYRNQTTMGKALYQMWLAGDLVTHHREGFDRIFDLAENVLGSERPAALDRLDAFKFFLDRTISTRPFMTPSTLRSSLTNFLHESVPQAEVNEHLDVLLEASKVSVVTIEQVRGRWLVPAPDIALLETIEKGTTPSGWIDPNTNTGVRLLSPLDPIVARNAAKRFFDFEYIWEIYKPEAKRKYGPFTMPILAGNSLVGRADLRNVVAENTLHVNGIWIERPVSSTFVDSLIGELGNLATFVGSDRFQVHRIEPGNLSGSRALNVGKPTRLS